MGVTQKVAQLLPNTSRNEKPDLMALPMLVHLYFLLLSQFTYLSFPALFLIVIQYGLRQWVVAAIALANNYQHLKERRWYLICIGEGVP